MAEVPRSGAGRWLLGGAWLLAAVGIVVLFAWHRLHWPVLLLTDPHLGYIVEVVAVAVCVGLAWRVLRAKGQSGSAAEWGLFVAAMAILASPYARHAYFKRSLRPAPIHTAELDAVRRLREMTADQEDYLRAHGAYADQSAALASPMRPQELLVLHADRERGWSAHLQGATFVCRLRVRNGAGDFPDLAAADGIPMCAQTGDGAEPEHSFPRQQDVRADIVPANYALRAIGASISAEGEWLQYRHNGNKTGMCCDGSASYRWRVSVGSQLRSTPVLVGDLLVVGAHGSGELVALDRRDGHLVWRARAPNWIHSDAVVRNGIVAVGFGNHGFPPGGVVAFALASGRRLWTRYAGSVMTTPAIWDSTVLFSDSDNLAWALDLRTGAVQWSSGVPGTAKMANPLVVDSTVYLTGSPRSICALAVRTGRRLWCRQLPGAEFTGESSPSATESTVIVSIIEDSTVEARLLSGSLRSAFRDLWMMLNQPRPSHIGGQLALGISRRDGALRWTQDLGGGFSIAGHIGGTATLDGGVGYVVSPFGRTVSALEATTGRRLWQQLLAGSSRGPPTVIRGRVLVVLADGAYVVRAASTGESVCAGALGYPVDRAGVTVAGATAYVTSLVGWVEALPVDELLRCARRIPPGRSVASAHER